MESELQGISAFKKQMKKSPVSTESLPRIYVFYPETDLFLVSSVLNYY